MPLSLPSRDAARAVALLALVYVAGAGAVLFRPEGSSVATWWPAAGVSVGLVALSPRRWWPALLGGIVAVSALANLTGGRGWEISLLFGLCNAAEALVVSAALARRDRARFCLDSPAAFFRLLTGCLLGALTLGLTAGLAVAVTGGDGLQAGLTAAPSHLASTLVILPLLLLPRYRALRHGQLWELAIQSSLFLVLTTLVFAPHHPYAIAFLPLPLLIWAALRFDPAYVAVQLLVLGVLSTGMTALGGGPFAVGARGDQIDAILAGVQVQAFLICAVMLAVPTALGASQLKLLLQRLTDERKLTDTTLETTAALILVTDAKGTILRVNPTACRLLGYAEDHFVDRPIWQTGMVPPERVEIVERLFSRPDGSSIPGTREADVMTSDGERMRVNWNNNVVLGPDGQVAHAVFTGVDVTSERTTSGMVQHLLEAPIATAVIGTDNHGRITLFNRAAQEMLGLPAQQALGQEISALVHSREPVEFIAGVAHGSGRPRIDELDAISQTSEWAWAIAGGGSLTMSTTISVVENGVGKRVGFLCVGRDVTEQRRTQEMLVAALEKERDAVERLRLLDAAKNDFVSTASHELRTPTTSIVGYTEMLLEGLAGEPSSEQVPMLEAIARNGSRLLAVASDLLMLSELETDTSQWQHEPVDLSQVISHAEEAIRPLLANRELSVEFMLPPREVVVEGDAAHLDRVLVNLLSNAIKFTPDGGSLCCRLAAVGPLAELSVTDDGIGIPEGEQGELFTKFFRSSTAQERAIQGTGLGLSIVSSIVAAHQGSIEVRSAHLQGTTFTVRLPITKVPAGTLSSG